MTAPFARGRRAGRAGHAPRTQAARPPAAGVHRRRPSPSLPATLHQRRPSVTDLRIAAAADLRIAAGAAPSVAPRHCPSALRAPRSAAARPLVHAVPPRGRRIPRTGRLPGVGPGSAGWPPRFDHGTRAEGPRRAQGSRPAPGRRGRRPDRAADGRAGADGRSDRIRTCDPQTPSLMRYQAAPRSDRAPDRARPRAWQAGAGRRARAR